MDQQSNNPQSFSSETVTYLSLGGVGEVTRNMHLYEYQNQVLIVDCGLGFADETMFGVDLLLPDISYLLKSNKKIVGIAITHGHEDHLGALPFILPQLPSVPLYATPFTAALINEKLKEFELQPIAKPVAFDGGEIRVGPFSLNFIRVTHSVPDTSHIFIKTPVGNFYHGSDYKFDLTPYDGKRTDFSQIVKTAEDGILCLLSDSLGSERPGHTPSEAHIMANFEKEMRECKGKFIVTTYSSNIARLNQAIRAAEKVNRKVIFIGRSLVKAKLVAQKMGILHMKDGTEIEMEDLRSMDDNRVMMLVAGTQGQENSAMTRIANNEHREIKLTPDDVVVFSSDTIPGNEVLVNELVDSILKRGAKAVYSSVSGHDFHVSGHGSSEDVKLLMSLTKPKHLLPISGTHKHLSAYKQLGLQMGYTPKNIHVVESGQEVIFSQDSVKYGKRIDINTVYVDQVSGEEVESYVLRDREKLAKDGIIILMMEISAATGQLTGDLEVIARGLLQKESQTLTKSLNKKIRSKLAEKKQRITNWVLLRKQMSDIAGNHIFRELRRRPLVLPVIIEV